MNDLLKDLPKPVRVNNNPLEGLPKPVKVEDRRPHTRRPNRQTTERPKPTGGYSENDLIEDQYYLPVRDYMTLRYGDHINEGTDRKEVVNKFMNNYRGFAAGNSVRSVSELAWLNSLDEEELQSVGEAYSIAENMEGLLTGEMSARERVGGLWDYTRTSLLDPANLLGFAIGKVAATGGTKTATTVARKAAQDAFRRTLTQQTAKGVSREVAREAAEKAGQKVWNETLIQLGKESTERAVARQALPSGVRRLTTTAGVREVAAATAFDSALAVGTDIAYQYGMIITGNQEEYSALQGGLSALGGLVMGGIQIGGIAATGRTGFVIPENGFRPSKEANARVVKQLGEDLTRFVEEGNWKADVASGRELKDLDTRFWNTLLLGDEDLEIKGVLRSMREQGYVWVGRSKDDKVTNYIGDVLKTAPEEDVRAFINLFENKTGVKMTDLSPEGEGIQEVTGQFVEQFANTLKRKMSDAGRTLAAASTASRILGKDVTEITNGDYGRLLLGDVPTQETKNLFSRSIEKSMDIAGSRFEKFQNNTIRMIVSNLATTQLNVGGWAFASTLNSISDIGLATLHGGGKMLKALTGDMKGAKEGWNMVAQSAALQRQKLANILDPQMTYDMFMAMAEANPKNFRELLYVLPGGVEDTSKLSRFTGFDPDQKMFGNITEDYVDKMGKLQFVKLQDVWTKSQEYMYQLDKGIRQKYNMSLADFMSDPNVAAKMATEDYMRIHAKANYETMRAIFSQSFKGKGMLGEVARVIEDARNIPGVGILVPFGRFFNNTIAFMSDATGVSLVGKAMGKNQQRTFGELGIRAAVSYGFVATLAQNELDYLDKGLNWDQEIDETTGEVVSVRYAFPYSAYKAAARLTAYKVSGREIPTELSQQIFKDVFGQLTRQLDESTQGVMDLINAAISDDAPDAGKMALDTVGKIASQFGSAWTRSLEPFNQTLALAKGTDFSAMDRKQGSEIINNTLRYVDQFAMSFGLIEGQQRYDAARGEPRADASKFFSPVRTQGPLSNTERIMNAIGRPTYLLNSMSMSPEADNRYNQLFNSLIEKRAGELWGKKSFQNGNLEQRQFQIDNLIKETKEYVVGIMEMNVAKSGDRYLKRMLDLSNKGRSNVERALKEHFDGRSLSDLNYNELVALEDYLKYKKDILEIQTK